jgi:hypothetical protein
MRFIVLLMTLALAGCASSTPYNPLDRESEPLWWQKTTVGVSKADNPWEKFNQPKAVRSLDNPWADFEEPRLFTDEFIKREKARRAKEEAIRKRFRKGLEKALYPKEF